MKQKFSKKVFTCFLIGTLMATFGFLTGFVFPGNPLNSDNSAYITAGSINYNESGDEQGEEPEATEQEVESWVCGNCGYIYDPAVGDPEHGIVAGTAFDVLPDSWVCPVCGESKAQFEDNQDIKTPEEWLAHLEHVLAMRSKHLIVLQRVIDAKIAKNPLLHSILSVQHALISSSNSVQKAQTAVDEYKAYMESLNNTTTTTTTETTEQNITTEGSQNTITSDNNENSKNNKNNEEKGNNGKGKAKGKNK
jgi:rubredoxin